MNPESGRHAAKAAFLKSCNLLPVMGPRFQGAAFSGSAQGPVIGAVSVTGAGAETATALNRKTGTVLRTFTVTENTLQTTGY